PSRVVIRPGEYRKLQSFEAGPFRFIAVGFMWYTSRGNPRYLSFDGVLVGPPGRLPPGVRIEFEAVQDDQGNNLGATRPGTSFIIGGLEWSAANPAELRVARPVSQYTNNTPVDEAVKLTKCRGRVRLAFVLGGRRILTLKDPGAGRKAESEGTSLVIEAWDRAAGRLTLRYCVEQIETDEAGESRGPAKAIWIAIHDAAGRRLEGEQKEVRILGIMSAGSVSDRSQGTLVVTVPPGFEPASVDLMEDTDVEEVMIPFDLGEVTLPARRQPKADR
ncbi:MAG TPA: hypothetical protein VK661_06175, partial [Planctomycetota bacterium]|nr:hypothetical protein [Planctomycetota bacterium]